jgi:hypothetical protein
VGFSREHKKWKSEVYRTTITVKKKATPTAFQLKLLEAANKLRYATRKKEWNPVIYLVRHKAGRKHRVRILKLLEPRDRKSPGYCKERGTNKPLWVGAQDANRLC